MQVNAYDNTISKSKPLGEISTESLENDDFFCLSWEKMNNGEFS